MSNRKIRRTARRKNAVVPMIIICAAVTVSALAAAVWQLNTPKVETLAPLELDPSVVEKFSSDSMAVPVKPSPKPAPSSVAPAASQPQSQAAAQPQSSSAESSQGSSGEQTRVSSSYFDDAVFIGDSLTVGIKLYDVMSNATVLASTGIGLDSIFTKQAIKQDDKTMLTVLDALKNVPCKKVYIMLGANSLMDDHDYLIGQYRRLVNEVRLCVGDDAIIYVQSVLPVNEPLFHKNYAHNTTTNADIDRFNGMLAVMSEELDARYLDVASVCKDENNSLPEAVTKDGMHISPEQYILWIDYLKTHTAQ